jgi:lipopolysaccharide transport system permease protein
VNTSRKSAADALTVTVIEPPSGWRTLDLPELWAYRELLWALTVRDLKVRYKQTVLGVAWAIIQPVTAMIIFSVIFGRLAGLPSDGYPYPVFVFAGLLPWTFFANAIGAIGGSVVGSAPLISKIYFPRLVIPLTPIGSGMVDFAISTGVLLLLMLYYGVPWGAGLVAVPLLVLGVVVTALGVGALLAALTVAYRDFRYVIPFLTQMWLFATPVVYPASLVPEEWRWALFFNPMAGWIEGFRAAFLGRSFEPLGLLISSAVVTVLLLGGLTYFSKVERRFADII